MKYLLLGAGGLLGSAFRERLAGSDVVTAGRDALDIRNHAAVQALVRESGADVVINTAAHTDVDGAERDPDPAFTANAILPGIIAQACRRAGARLVHVSSTGCYGNELTRAYTEEDPLRPTTVHHRSKASGEQAVREAACEALILRTGWLFGGGSERARNFVRARLNEARNNPVLTSDATQRGNPTWVDDVVRQALLLLDEGMLGTFNCVGRGVASRFDYVSHIVSLSGLPCEVRPSAEPFRRAAAVSPNEGADNFRLRLLGLDRMPDWRQGVDDYLASVAGDPGWSDLLPDRPTVARRV